MSTRDTRVRTSSNMVWTPRPGWATIRLVGTCGDRTLRRGQVVLHSPSEESPVLGRTAEIPPGSIVIVISEAARLIEDDLHLVPESAVVAVGDALP